MRHVGWFVMGKMPYSAHGKFDDEEYQIGDVFIDINDVHKIKDFYLKYGCTLLPVYVEDNDIAHQDLNFLMRSFT